MKIIQILVLFVVIEHGLTCHPTVLTVSEVNKQAENGKEFIELRLPTGLNATLDGFCVVVWQGFPSSSTGVRPREQFDLSGFETNEDGYFIIGGAGLDGDSCCTSGQPGYLKVNSWDTFATNNAKIVVTVYYGGDCDFTIDELYTATDGIQDNLVDVFPGSPNDFNKLFNPNYDSDNTLSTINSQSDSYFKCADDTGAVDCFDQSGSGGQVVDLTKCVKKGTPSPGMNNNCD